MITRSRAKMTNNSDSMDFEINNQLSVAGSQEDTTPSDNNSVENVENRAGTQTSQHREIDFQLLMDFVRHQNDETRKQINEKLEKQKDELEQHNKQINEKLEKQKDELEKQNAEQFRQLKTELQENNKKWEEKISELQKKTESAIKELKDDLKRQTEEDKELSLIHI